MAKKIFLRDENNIKILPITRGELILDSSGKQAFRSNEFLATDSQPGLMSPADKQKLDTVAGNTVDTELSNTSTNPVQNKVLTQIINSIREKYLKSAVVSGNKVTITDQSNNTVEFVNSTYQIVTNAVDGLVPKYDAVDGTIDAQTTDWVLTNHNGTLGWYKLPVAAFSSSSVQLFIGAKSTSNNNNSNSATTNGNTYLKLFDNSTLKNQYNIKGTGLATVISDDSGTITINVPTSHNQASSDINSLAGYAKATAIAAIATSDSLNTALGKLELKADTTYELVKGAYDGDGTIENLAEILKVLEGISDTETIQAIVGKYLPLTGGMMSGNITFDVNRMIRWHQSDSYSISCPTGNDGAYLLLKAHNGITAKKRLSIYTNAESLPNTNYNLYTDGSLYANSGTFGSVNLGSGDLNFKGADPGDIAWYDADNKEKGRIYYDGTALALRHDAGTTYKILHTGNAYISNGTITINGVSITPLTSIPAHGIHWENFTKRATSSATWGTLTSAKGYTPIFWLDSVNGGGVAFSDYNGKTYLQIDGDYYANEGASLVLHTANYNSYAPTLTGTGASGTWGINISGTAANAETLDSIDSTGFLRYYNSNAAPSNVDVVNTPSYVWTVSTTGGTVATATKPSGIDNAWGVIHLHTHPGNYATQLGFGGTTGRMYMRNAYNTSTFGSWKALAFTSDIPTSLPADGGNADTVDGYHAASFAKYYADSAYNADTIDDGIHGGKLYGASVWPLNYYAFLSVGYSNYKMQFNARNNVLYFRAGTEDGLSTMPWVTIIHSGNIGSQSVNYATSAGSANTATSATSANYSRNLLGRNTLGTDYSAVAGNLIFAEWNTQGDNRWYLKADGYETRVGYANNSDKLDGIDSTGFLRQVVVANNTTNDFNTFGNMTLTGRVDPTTGASLVNAPWTGGGPAGGYGVLTYLFNGSGYGTQMAWGYNSNRIYIRNRYWGGSGVGSVWSTTWDSLALTSDIPTVTNYYWANVQISDKSNSSTSPTFANATTTGLLTVSTGGSHCGIKVGNNYINAINGELIIQNNTAIRFGDDAWDYDVWAGLKYVSSAKTIHLGIADRSIFSANNALGGGTLNLPGIRHISSELYNIKVGSVAQHTPSTSGWYTVAQVSGYFNYDIYITGGWHNGMPSTVRVNICNINGTSKITQLAGYVGGICSQIRLGKVSTDIWDVQVYIPTQPGTMGEQRCIFTGFGGLTVHHTSTLASTSYSATNTLAFGQISGISLTTDNYTSYLDSRYYTETESDGRFYPLAGSVNMSGDNKWIGSTMGGGTDYWRIGGYGSSDNGICKITIGDNSNDKFQIEIADYSGTTYIPLEVINTGINITGNATMTRGVVGGYNNTSYALSTASFICNSWIRTNGATGWYNEDYGGGWYMTDATWIRNYNSKPIYLSVSTYPSLVCNAQGGSEANIRFEIAGANKGYTGYKTGYGTFLWNSTAAKYVYIADNGYFYTQSYINVGAGNEKNASNPPYVWGVNGSDNFMRTYATSSLSVNYANSASYAHYLPTKYDGGQQTNPQTYFNNGIGLRVAMTGLSSKGTSYWSDTLWINGYSGGDVPNMCALHFNRDGTPRAFISTQSNQSSSYGTLYELITGYNIGSQSVNYATYSRYVYCTSGSYLNFQWSGQSGQPTWLFGSNDGANVYVWNPSNFSVNYANSAGSATKATQDGNGNTISSYYVTLSTDQTITGKKTFSNVILFSGNDSYGIRTATNNYVRIGESSYRFYQCYVTSYYATSGFYQDSDIRLKNIVQNVEVNLDDLAKLQKVYYTWKSGIDTNKHIGMIAQEVQKLYPELVNTDEETGYLSLSYDQLSVIALKAIDKLYAMIKDVQDENKHLKERLNQLENRIS